MSFFYFDFQIPYRDMAADYKCEVDPAKFLPGEQNDDTLKSERNNMVSHKYFLQIVPKFLNELFLETRSPHFCARKQCYGNEHKTSEKALF